MSKKATNEKVIAPYGVKHVIAVASGKGGVGKSTIAANLALALKSIGLKTGLMDADIYGPSVPRLMGITGIKPETTDTGKIKPLAVYGIKVMSMGFMIDENAPIIWRGPMVSKAIKQFLYDVDWGNLDILVIDMPPGTGDAQLTLAQKSPLSGAIIVTTPQDIALIDARKGLEMFRKVGAPVLGLIENMSMFICPHCGKKTHIFGQDGAKREAEKIGCDFIGSLPLDSKIRETSDLGTPVVTAEPESPHTNTFTKIAKEIAEKLNNNYSC